MIKSLLLVLKTRPFVILAILLGLYLDLHAVFPIREGAVILLATFFFGLFLIYSYFYVSAFVIRFYIVKKKLNLILAFVLACILFFVLTAIIGLITNFAPQEPNLLILTAYFIAFFTMRLETQPDTSSSKATEQL